MQQKATRTKKPRRRSAPEASRRKTGYSRSAPAIPRRQQMMTLAGIALTAIMLYLNTISNALVYDDKLLIPNNPTLEQPWDLGTIFSGAYWGEIRSGAIYRPLTAWTLAANHALNEASGVPGESPPGYHVVNILFHATACCMLYLFLIQLPIPVWVSAVTAFLFAAHPIHTEAVAGIVGRAEVLALLFGMIYLILHHQRRLMGLGAIVYLLAMWSKESAVAFFPLAVALDMLFRHPSTRWPGTAYGLYALTMGVWFVLRLQALGDVQRVNPFVDNPLAAVNLTVAQRLLTVAAVQFKYLLLQVIPVGLSSDYSFKAMAVVGTAADGRVLGFLVLFLAGVAVAYRYRTSHPAVAFAVLGYAILFSTTSNILVTIGTIMGERLAYSPSACICLLLAYGAWRILRQAGHRVMVAVPAAVCLVFGLLTVQRNETWADELTFYRVQIESAPDSAKAHYNYGSALAVAGDDSLAVEEYKRAIEIFPYYPEPFYNMGNALRRLKAGADEVISAYRNAIKYDRGHRHALANLASYLIELNRIDEARPLLVELEKLDPTYPSLAYLKMRIDRRGSSSNAINVKNRESGTAVPPGVQQAILAYTRGDYAGAIASFEAALTAGTIPAHMRRTALIMLARSYEATGQSERARAYQQQADSLGQSNDTPSP